MQYRKIYLIITGMLAIYDFGSTEVVHRMYFFMLRSIFQNVIRSVNLYV